MKAKYDDFLFTIKYLFPSLPNSNILFGDILQSVIVKKKIRLSDFKNLKQ